MPWLTVDFLGKLNLSLDDIYIIMLQAHGTPMQSSGSSLPIVFANINTIIATILLYPVVIVLAALSIVFRKISVASGALVIVTGLLWASAIESLKEVIAQKEIGIVIVSFVKVGYGTYVAVIGGFVLFIAFFYNIIEVKKHQGSQ